MRNSQNINCPKFVPLLDRSTGKLQKNVNSSEEDKLFRKTKSY